MYPQILERQVRVPFRSPESQGAYLVCCEGQPGHHCSYIQSSVLFSYIETRRSRHNARFTSKEPSSITSAFAGFATATIDKEPRAAACNCSWLELTEWRVIAGTETMSPVWAKNIIFRVASRKNFCHSYNILSILRKETWASCLHVNMPSLHTTYLTSYVHSSHPWGGPSNNRYPCLLQGCHHLPEAEQVTEMTRKLSPCPHHLRPQIYVRWAIPWTRV